MYKMGGENHVTGTPVGQADRAKIATSALQKDFFPASELTAIVMAALMKTKVSIYWPRDGLWR